MKLGIMQAYYFPYIGYFQHINACDRFVLYEHVSFRKRSWVTRNRLLDKGTNNPFYFQLNVSSSSISKHVSSVELVNRDKSDRTLLKYLQYNYKKALYYDEIYGFLEILVNDSENTLHGFNALIIRGICQLLNISTDLITRNTDCYYIEEELKERSKKFGHSSMTQRVMDLCNHHKANHYINPIGGINLYSKEEFSDVGLALSFVQSNPIVYPQFNSHFVPSLSIIDVLMHNGVEKTAQYLNRFKLV